MPDDVFDFPNTMIESNFLHLLLHDKHKWQGGFRSLGCKEHLQIEKHSNPTTGSMRRILEGKKMHFNRNSCIRFLIIKMNFRVGPKTVFVLYVNCLYEAESDG